MKITLVSKQKTIALGIILGMSMSLFTHCDNDNENNTSTSSCDLNVTTSAGAQTISVKDGYYTLKANANLSIPKYTEGRGQGGSKFYRVIYVPQVQEDTIVRFTDIQPTYAVSGSAFHLVYQKEECPINILRDELAPIEQMDRSFMQGSSTEYTFSDASFTFTSAASGKNYFIVIAPSAQSENGKVQRTK